MSAATPWQAATRRRCLLLVLALWLLVCCSPARTACPSLCNRRGVCESDNTCTCFAGYTGFDCQTRECPRATPWVGFATADDVIRSVTQECSLRGRCNRDTGRCDCDSGFTGAACERLELCRSGCSGHGKCLSMRALAATRDDYKLLHSAVYMTPWDADRIFGCVCDYGYSGVDCSERQCPFGDDPMSSGQVDEVQALSCLCDGCSGSFTLAFRGQTTRPLDGAVDTAETLQAALEELLTIRSVTVTLDGGTTLCDVDGVSALVTFTHDHGDVPALVVSSSLAGGTSALSVETDGAAAAYGSLAVTQTGTKEWLECSGRGSCNTLTGLCTCMTDFEASDGLGGAGIIQDCGYYSGSGMTTCAGVPQSVLRCNARGSCSGTPLYQCSCDEGYRGYDCFKFKCPAGRAWVEEAQTDNVAHNSLVECSNAGLCNSEGKCRCLPGFEGAACERMSCPSVNGAVCNNRGTCKSAREIAALTPTDSYTTAGFVYGSDPNAVETWDADMTQGCYCDKVPFGRGANVRYMGYNCAKMPCPSGDDPWTTSQVDEVQTVSCTADGGTFTLSFRGETTLPLLFSSPAGALKAALEDLITISSVSIAFPSGITTACTDTENGMDPLLLTAIVWLFGHPHVNYCEPVPPFVGKDITISFHSPSGDLPLLMISDAALTHSTASVVTSVMETTRGTKEDAVCNNRGRCDEDTGECICARHHASGDAQGGFGVMGDCGAVDSFMTHGEL